MAKYHEMRFPLAGINLARAFNDQQPREVGPGEWGRSTPGGTNVRGFEPGTDRGRGGNRPGYTKYMPQAVGNIPGWITQELAVVYGGQTAVQSSLSGRVLTGVGVSQGQVFTFRPGDTTFHVPVNATGNNPPLIFTGLVRSAPNVRKLWFADGSNWVYYDPLLDQVLRWTADQDTLDSGSNLPVDSDNNTPRLICTWRGRTVLSGIIGDPQNIFMSKVNEPRNFNYFPDDTTPTQAFAGNFSPQGLIGDAVMSLCPYSDDVLICFCDHSIFAFSGDPLAGGQIDLITDTIGGTFGINWTRDPFGTVYFMSNKMGVYAMVPGQQPVRISQAIEQLLQQIDTGQNVVRLFWNDRYQGLSVKVTRTDMPRPTVHHFWEQRTGAWWKDEHANDAMNPVCGCIFDGNLPDDRVVLYGAWDGFVRYEDPAAPDDDGTPIDSEVLIGPLLTKETDDVMFEEAQAVLGETSGEVNYDVLIGPTAEAALTAAPADSGTWEPSRNYTSLIRQAGHALYIHMNSSVRWAMESVKILISLTGVVRGRGNQ